MIDLFTGYRRDEIFNLTQRERNYHRSVYTQGCRAVDVRRSLGSGQVLK